MNRKSTEHSEALKALNQRAQKLSPKARAVARRLTKLKLDKLYPPRPDTASTEGAMKGWVYVITNKAMPGLVKIGYSLKDPALRAGDFRHTNNPHPFVVAYEAIVQDPERVEKKAHATLHKHREGGEWFRCSVETAVVAIKEACNGIVIGEETRFVDSNAVTKEYEEKKRVEAVRAQWKSKKEEHLKSARDELARAQAAAEPKNSFFWIWVGVSFVVFIALLVITNPRKEEVLIVPAAILGALAAAFVKSHLDEKHKRDNGFYAAKERFDKRVDEIEGLVLNPCPGCNAILRIEAPPNTDEVACPRCKAAFKPVFSLHD